MSNLSPRRETNIRKLMTVQTFKARSIQEALQMVRESLGTEATILETRTVFAGLLPWFRRPSHVIVSASCEVKTPSRLPPTTSESNYTSPAETVEILNALTRPSPQIEPRPMEGNGIFGKLVSVKIAKNAAAMTST